MRFIPFYRASFMVARHTFARNFLSRMSAYISTARIAWEAKLR